MKARIFSVISALVYGTAYGRLGHPHTSKFVPLEDRHHLDTCNWQCDAAVGNITILTNWEIDVIVSENGSLLLSFGYDTSLKVFAFIHQTLNIAVTVNGHTGSIGWFNIQTGSCIVINATNGLAAYVYSADVRNLLSRSSSVRVGTSIVAFSKVVASGSSLIQPGANSTVGKVFNLRAIIDAIYKNPTYVVTAEANFNGRRDLQEQISTNFNVWFDAMREQIANGDVNVDFGIVGFFAPVFDHPHALSLGILKLFAALFDSTSGVFDGQFSLIVYKILSVTIPADDTTQAFSSLTATIQAIGYFYANLDAALSAYSGGTALIHFQKKNIRVGNATYLVAHGKSADGSWFITLKSGDSVDVVMLYVKSSNVFAIYNRKLSVIIVFSGSTGLFAIWNVKTGEGIVVRHATSGAIVINSDAAISESFSAGAVFHGCAAITTKIQSYRTFRYSLLDRSTFLFSTYILTVQTKGVAVANVGVSSTVRAVIIDSFKPYFELVAKERSSLIHGFDVLNVIYVTSGGVTGWSVQIQKFVASIYTSKLHGQFNYQLFAEFYREASSNVTVVGSDSFLANLTATVKRVDSPIGSIDSVTNSTGRSLSIKQRKYKSS